MDFVSNRRKFLARTLGTGLAPMLPWSLASACGGPASGAGTKRRELWVSAGGEDVDAYGLVVSGPATDEPRHVRSGFRGHDVAQNPARPSQVVLFSRRPGSECIVVDIERGRLLVRFHASAGRRFQGHGFFSPDGGLLYTSEADAVTGAGAIGVRETQRYEPVDALDSYGIGPHEIALMPDGATIVVANGGILTRPETGREKLNLDTMDPSLTYVDRATGARLEQRRLPESKASIRHLDVAADGTVAVGLQVQREALDHDRVVALGALHRRGRPLEPLDDPLGLFAAMDDYVGSVAICPGPRVVGLTSPRGDVVGFWSLDDRATIGYHALADVCGLASSLDGDHFIASSSLGQVRTLRASDAHELVDARRRDRDLRWDNHLIAVSVEEDLIWTP